MSLVPHLRHRSIVGLALAVVAAVSTSLPTMAQDGAGASPSAGPTVTIEVPAGIDIADYIPATIGGVAPEVGVVRGQDHFAEFDVDDSFDVEQVAAMEDFLDQLGATVEDMHSVSAFTLEGQDLSLLAGVQVKGADPEMLLDVYIDQLLADMQLPFQEPVAFGGKPVTRLEDQATPRAPAIFVYGSGDIVWLLAAPENVVEVLLGQLP